MLNAATIEQPKGLMSLMAAVARKIDDIKDRFEHVAYLTKKGCCAEWETFGRIYRDKVTKKNLWVNEVSINDTTDSIFAVHEVPALPTLGVKFTEKDFKAIKMVPASQDSQQAFMDYCYAWAKEEGTVVEDRRSEKHSPFILHPTLSAHQLH